MNSKSSQVCAAAACSQPMLMMTESVPDFFADEDAAAWHV
jgi:hypothetical protein